MIENTILKVKKFNETTLYHGMIILFKKLNLIIKHMPQNYMGLYGKDIVNDLFLSIDKYKHSYNEKSNSEKIKLLQDVFNILGMLDTRFLILRELEIITVKQYSNIIIELGKLQKQTNNFINSLSN